MRRVVDQNLDRSQGRLHRVEQWSDRSGKLAEVVETLQNMLVSFATGGVMTPKEYQQFRQQLQAALGERLPRFIRVNRDASQLWTHFKKTSPTYQGRREYV